VAIRRGSNPAIQDTFSPTADETKAVAGKGLFEMEQALVLTVLKVTVSLTKQKENCNCIFGLSLQLYKAPLTGGEMEHSFVLLERLVIRQGLAIQCEAEVATGLTD
jgi:hypothetical protein